MTRIACVLACASLLIGLLGCEEELLSVGELRCQGVSCENVQRDWGPQRDSRHLPRPELLPELHAERVLPMPCELGPECQVFEVRMLSIERDGVPGPVLAAHIGTQTLDQERAEHWLWLGRPTAQGWEGEASLSLGQGVLFSSRPITLAAQSGRPDTVIVTISEPLSSQYSEPHVLRTFRYGSDDEIEPLFEDLNAGVTHDTMMLGDDLLVIDDYRSTLELTRYSLDGEVRWRQTALETTRADGPESDYDLGQLRVLDDGTIAALIPTRFYRGAELVLLDGDGQLQHRYEIEAPFDAATGLYLEVDDDGNVIVGSGGYAIDRFTLGEEVSVSKAMRARALYYALSVYNLDVGDSGWTYVTTQDGPVDERVELLERVSPDMSRVESMRLVTDERGDCASLLKYGSEGLSVDADEAAVYIASVYCYAEFALPPLTD